MSSTQLPLALKYAATLAPYDRRSHRALMRQTNRIALVGDLARVAMDEVTVTFVTAQDLVARALTTAHRIQSRSAPSEASQDSLHTLTQHYLESMVFISHHAAGSINRRLVEESD